MASLALPDALIETLRSTRSVAAVTGAGISAESGIQTYRGSGGLYDDPVEGDRTMEALSAPTIATDPDRTWRAISRMAEQACHATPNAGHEALVEIERSVDDFVILTQNVDGLHRAAGSQNVIEVHGTVFHTTCMSCSDSRPFERNRYLGLAVAPRCEECDGILRPDVVLFGEFLPVEASRRMQAEFDHELPDVVLGIGTSSMFPYIVAPVLRAAQQGKVSVEINPEETDVSAAYTHVLRGTAGEVLPLIAEVLAK